jgi:hypothetical protein
MGAPKIPEEGLKSRCLDGKGKETQAIGNGLWVRIPSVNRARFPP